MVKDKNRIEANSVSITSEKMRDDLKGIIDLIYERQVGFNLFVYDGDDVLSIGEDVKDVRYEA